MRDVFKELPCLIPLLFLFAYALPVFIVIGNYRDIESFIVRLLGTLTFVTIFAQVMTGSFRQFLIKRYNPKKIFLAHNYLGVSAMILLLLHYASYNLFYNSDLSVLLFNATTPIILGVAGLYLMLLTVLSSDIKFFFKINYSQRVWRAIHLLNYALLLIAYFHTGMIGSDMISVVYKTLINTYLVLGVIALFHKLYKAFSSRTH